MKLPDFSLACAPLCKQKLKRDLKRPHVSCATCLDRRYHYGKVDRSLYAKIPANQPFMLCVPSSIILPKNSKWYFLIVNQNCCRVKRIIKRLAIKYLRTIEELFANW